MHCTSSRSNTHHNNIRFEILKINLNCNYIILLNPDIDNRYIINNNLLLISDFNYT